MVDGRRREGSQFPAYPISSSVSLHSYEPHHEKACFLYKKINCRSTVQTTIVTAQLISAFVFCFTYSTIPLLKSEISGYKPTFVSVQASLCWTCSKILKTYFLVSCDMALITTESLWEQMSRLVGKPTMWFPNSSDTNQAAQSQKQARSLTFRI